MNRSDRLKHICLSPAPLSPAECGTGEVRPDDPVGRGLGGAGKKMTPVKTGIVSKLTANADYKIMLTAMA